MCYNVYGIDTIPNLQKMGHRPGKRLPTMTIVRAKNSFTGEVLEITSRSNPIIGLYDQDMDILIHAAYIIKNMGFDGDTLEVIAK